MEALDELIITKLNLIAASLGTINDLLQKKYQTTGLLDAYPELKQQSDAIFADYGEQVQVIIDKVKFLSSNL